ncbi:hypothetical protein [Streptomyces sp. NPDC045470]|uniref:hypothetical protein n=1 Tax=Streptomyces sp. NPDC045470 TaxID=3155469 RepID=UPI0033C20F1B
MPRTPTTTPAPPAAPARRPSLLIRPGEYADHRAVKAFVRHHPDWMDQPPGEAAAAGCTLVPNLGVVERGHPVTWLLLEDGILRSCALVTKDRMRTPRWDPKPGGALWIGHLYERRDAGAQGYGALLIDWLLDYGAQQRVRWLAAHSFDGPLAGHLGERYGLEVVHDTTPGASLFILRRKAKRLPRLASAVRTQLPPCVLRRQARTTELPRAD